MSNKNQCVTSDCRCELLVAEALVNPICPTCGMFLKLTRLTTQQGLKLEHAVAAVLLGFGIYYVIKS